jgi:release factor glutamine methyltransferase
MRTGEPSPPVRIADVGTGSACLAVALAHELPHAEIFATDISAAALDVARRNTARHGVSSRVHFFEGDLLKPMSTSPGSFDLIVSNPPYVAQDSGAMLAREVREHEPHTALFGGPSGVEMYERLVQQAGELLRSGGVLVLELGYNSAQPVRAVLVEQRNWVNVSVTDDLAGIPRVLSAERAQRIKNPDAF